MQCPNEEINPLTKMPYPSTLQATSQDGEEATITAQLSTERTASSIPRADAEDPEAKVGTWLYPSQRMFFNALQRKGMPTDPSDIEAMLDVHNFLNEAVWHEILKWESRHKR